jgi:hypothetical protein
VDVATTGDGAFVLMHDDTLDRTTTGSGPTTSRTLAEVLALKLGRPGARLDVVFLADGNPSEYVDLVRAGVVMIASDAAVAAQRAIGTGYRACFQSRPGDTSRPSRVWSVA